MFKVTIPTISDEELLRRYERIRPICHLDDGRISGFRNYTLEELRHRAYTWDFDDVINGPIYEYDELAPTIYSDFGCLFTYGHPGLFKPTVAEVLAQIDMSLYSFSAAFEIIDRPQTVDDFYRTPLHKVVFEAGYHVATVRLYHNPKNNLKD